MTDVYDTTNWKRLPDGTPVFVLTEHGARLKRARRMVKVASKLKRLRKRLRELEHERLRLHETKQARRVFIAESERDQYRCAAHQLSEYATVVAGEYDKLTRVIMGVQHRCCGGSGGEDR